MSLFNVSPGWFITEMKGPLRLFQIYVRGDAIVLVPFLIGISLVGIFSLKWMVLLFTIYFSFRFLGEMIYWLLQQFGEKKYRAPDLGFKNLGNAEIYVLQQLKALVGLVVSTGLLVYVISNWK